MIQKVRTTRWVRFLAIYGVVICYGAQSHAQDADYSLYKDLESKRKVVGPLVGHVTDTTASIWAYAGPRTGPVALDIAEFKLRKGGPEEDAAPASKRLMATADSKHHHAVKFDLSGLKPETSYTFVVRLPELADENEQGFFRTAPPKGEGSKFRMAVSSCFGGQYRREDGRTTEKRGYRNDSWKLLMARKPDFQLIIGDVVYADSTDYNHLWDSHTLERTNNEPFGGAIRMMPTYAVWDDHDYGPNDSDGTAAGKEQSLRAFHELYANPPRTGGGGEGIYTRFDWGGVDFFLLDGRYHRTPNTAPDDDKKRYLGDEQFEWLVEQLKASTAPFKLLVNGSTWAASGKDDCWGVFNFERRRLWEAIVKHKIGGVVFVSGDLHRCDLPLHWPEVEGGYLMPEIISSGLGSHGEHDTMGFVYVDFDTTAADPTMTAHVVDGEGREPVIRQVRASELQVHLPNEH